MSTTSKSTWIWVEPLVHDALLTVYNDAFGAGPLATAISRAHARVWQAMLEGHDDSPGLETVMATVESHGHSRHLVSEATAAVAVELADVLRRRFRTSERQLWAHRNILVAATAGLARAR